MFDSEGHNFYIFVVSDAKRRKLTRQAFLPWIGMQIFQLIS